MAVNAPVISAEVSLTHENGTAPGKPQQAPSEVFQLLKANTPFTVWLIFVAIGGGLLALYYARIGYVPDIEWGASLIYLFAATLVGGVVGLLLALSLFLPGFIWSEVIVYDACFENHFSYDAPGNEPIKELCIRSVATDLGIPFLLVLLLSHVALLAGKELYWVAAIALLMITFGEMRVRFTRLASTSTTNGEAVCPEKILHRHIFVLSSWFTLSILLSQVSMYLIYRLSGTPERLSTFTVLTLMCITGVCISNHVVALRYKYYPRQAIVASLVAAALMLFAADRISPLSVRLMSYYGFGGDTKVNLLINEQGTQIVNGLGVPHCGTQKLCNVEILSKLGNEYFLNVDGKTFTLPKNAVTAVQSEDRRYR